MFEEHVLVENEFFRPPKITVFISVRVITNNIYAVKQKNERIFLSFDYLHTILDLNMKLQANQMQGFHLNNTATFIKSYHKVGN